jgi:hypothetical protein
MFTQIFNAFAVYFLYFVDQLHAYIFCTLISYSYYSNIYNVIYLMYSYLYILTLTDINMQIERFWLIWGWFLKKYFWLSLVKLINSQWSIVSKESNLNRYFVFLLGSERSLSGLKHFQGGWFNYTEVYGWVVWPIMWTNWSWVGLPQD